MKEITAYVCDFCPRRKARLSKGHTRSHEAKCYYNPARKACATCGHFTYERHFYEPETGYNGGGAGCEEDYFNVIQPDDPPSKLYRSECEKWIPREELHD